MSSKKTFPEMVSEQHSAPTNQNERLSEVLGEVTGETIPKGVKNSLLYMIAIAVGTISMCIYLPSISESRIFFWVEHLQVILWGISSLIILTAVLLYAVYIVSAWHARRQYRQQARERELRGIEKIRRIEEWKRDADVANSTDTSAPLSEDPVQRFEKDDMDGMVRHLQDHGYAVVKGILEEEELKESKVILWDFLEKEVGMMRGDPSTWDNTTFSRIGSKENGIINGKDFNQSELPWFIRTRPAVREAFAAIWKDSTHASSSDLITSFDGGNIYRPFHTGGADQKTSGGWWHVDQGPTKIGLQAVQGFVSLTDATPQTGGLCVIPGSHTSHDDLMSYAPRWDDDFVIVPEPEINPACRGGKLVQCKAGDLVLWDSRTIHCNTPALRDPSVESGYPHNELLRAVIYVCMSPRSMASTQVQKLRRAVYGDRIGTSHWPHELRDSLVQYCSIIDDAEIEEAFSTRFADKTWFSDCHALI